VTGITSCPEIHCILNYTHTHTHTHTCSQRWMWCCIAQMMFGWTEQQEQKQHELRHVRNYVVSGNTSCVTHTHTHSVQWQHTAGPPSISFSIPIKAEAAEVNVMLGCSDDVFGKRVAVGVGVGGHQFY